MKPANLSHMQTLLARSQRHTSKLRFTIHDLGRKCGLILAALFVFAIVGGSANGATYTWSGAAGASWAVSTNWTPTRTTPALTDVLQFNSGGSNTPTAVPTQTIGQLLISNNTAVTLTSAAGTLTLSVGQGIAGTDLDVQSGSSLTLSNGGTAFTLNYAGTSTTGSIAGTLTVNTNVTWNVTTGTTPTTTVTGTVICANTVTGSTTTLTFSSGGKYTHNRNAGTVPTATWDANSTVEITGITASQPAGLGQTFGHFTWNCPAQSSNIGLGSPASFAIAGTLTVTSTGGVSNRAVRFTSNAAYTLLVSGSLILNGGHLGLTSGTGTMALTVAGDVQISNSSELYLSQGGSADGTLNIAGNLSVSTGTITETGSSTGHLIVFNKAGSQTFSATSATFSNDLNYTVNASSTLGLNNDLPVNAGRTVTDNGTLNCGTNVVSGAGTFTLAAGATLGIGDLNGITTSACGTGATCGNIRTTSRTFTALANYVYNGAASQDTGNALVTPLNLTISTNGTATANAGLASVDVNGDFTISSGSTFNAAGKNFSLAGNNWINDGTYTPGSATQSVVISGAGAVTIKGAQPTAFARLVINNTGAGTTQMTTSCSVSDVLRLDDDLTVVLPAVLTQTGTSDAASTKDVVGTVHRSDLGAAPVQFGNPNVQVSVDVTTTITTLEVFLSKGSAPASFPSAVQRIYSLDPGSGTLGTATVRLHYLDSELNGNAGAALHLWRASGPSAGSATWADQGAPSGSATASDPNNWIENNNVTGFSTWALAAASPGPTAVRLTKFNAASFSDGVQLTWQSGFEVNNLGYRLYREQNGHRSRVTPSVVAGSALTVGQGNRLTAGSSYLWFDQQGTPGTSYYLEAIDLDGSRQTYGPITPYAGSRNVVSPKRQRALLLSELGRPENNSNGTPGQPASVTNLNVSNIKLSNNSSVQQAIAGGKAVKIQVRQSGWYRVTQPELVAAGLDPTSDARLLQLYVDGEEVPVRLSAEGARLNANDTLEFYGVALDTLTTDTRTYWLINGTTDGKRISSKRNKLKPGNENWTETVGLRNFAFTTERRDKIIYSPRLLNGDASNIFGALIFSDPTDQNLTVRNFDGTANTQPQLEIALQGLTAQSHQVHVSINGTSLGNMTFNASQHPTATFAVNPALLHAGDNTVSLSSNNGDSDVSFVDYIRLTYAHQFTADDNALRFSMPGGSVVRVDGFTTPNIRVVDVTDPSSPVEVTTSGTSSLGGYSVKVQALGNGTRTLMAFADQLARHPAAIFANKPSNWNASANGADLLVVTHDDFRQQVEPLAALRRSQGMSVAVVDIEDVYDEFSYGAHTPEALKAFLATASSSWSRKPGYVLLVGDSSWDPRNFMEQGENDFVPTKLIDTAFMETASDDWLVDFSGQGRADMAVGRLPGSSAAEISLMVSKIMSYEQEREVNAPLRGAVMVADSGFESQSAQTRNLLPVGLETQSLNRSQIGNDDLMRGQLIDALNAGPMIVNFYGHGSTRVWTEAGVLDSDLADALTNSNRSSIYLMMTCLNGYASDAYIDSLSEAVLKSQNGGAVAVWASSGYTSPEPQFAMNAQFYRLLFGAQTLRLGEAAREAKLATSDLDVRRTWMLFGDPTMRVR